MNVALSPAGLPALQPADRRMLTVVMHVDIVGYLDQILRDDPGTLARLRAFGRDVVVPEAARAGGRRCHTGGESFLIVFDSIDGALRAALAIQHSARFLQRPSPQDPPMRFRIGIDMGDVIHGAADVHGDGAVIAERLEKEAAPGEICVSRAIRDNARARPDLSYEPLGSLALRTVDRRVEAFILRQDRPVAADHLAASWQVLRRALRTRRFRRHLRVYGAALLAASLVLELGWVGWRASHIPISGATLPAPARVVDETRITPAQRRLIDAFSRDHDVPVRVLEEILLRLGATNISRQPDELWRQLDAKVREYEALRNEAALLLGDDPKVAALRKDAASLADQGDFEGARADLRLAARIDQRAVQLLTEHVRVRAFGGAQSLADSARIAALTSQYREAASDLTDAAALVAPFEPRRQAELLAGAGRQLADQGRYFGDRDAQNQAIGLFRHALDLAEPGGDPALTSQIEQDLGDALNHATSTGMSNGSIEAAIAAYAAALQWRTVAAAPVLWAQTTTRLAAALDDQTFLTNDTKSLHEAIEKLHGVVRLLDPKQHPAEWADAEFELGVALGALDDYEPDTNLLRDSVRALRSALAREAPGSDAYARARIERVLINSLGALGARELDRANLAAVDAEAGRALQGFPWARLPDLGASLQSHDAVVLALLSLRDVTTTRLHAAMALWRPSLEQRETEQVALPLADGRNDMGRTLTLLGEREAQPAILDQAADAFRAAMQTWTRDRLPFFWARAQRGLGEALLVKAELAGDHAAMAHARDALLEARATAKPGLKPQEDLPLAADIVHAEAVLAARAGASHALAPAMNTLRTLLTAHWREEFPVEWAQGERALGEGYAALAAHETRGLNLQNAIDAFDSAQTVATQAALPFDWAKTEADRAAALTALGLRTETPRRFAEAVQAYDAALNVFREGNSPYYVALCEQGRAVAAAHRATQH